IEHRHHWCFHACQGQVMESDGAYELIVAENTELVGVGYVNQFVPHNSIGHFGNEAMKPVRPVAKAVDRFQAFPLLAAPVLCPLHDLQHAAGKTRFAPYSAHPFCCRSNTYIAKVRIHADPRRLWTTQSSRQSLSVKLKMITGLFTWR